MRLEIIKNTKRLYLISAIVISVGLILGLLGGFNLGIDFTGGTMFHIKIGQEFKSSDIQDLIEPFDLKAEINYSGADKDEVIIKTAKSLKNEERIEVYDAIATKYNLVEDNLLAINQFGPKIGDEMQQKALISIIIASIGMLIYITIRFEIRFALAAVAALVHDILFLLAFYGAFRIPINSAFIAAILIIVGYSINDTIVVFDRIRENVVLYKKMKTNELVDMSINQTLRRSINTSFTTFLAIGCLYIFGVVSIKEFALPIVAGVLSGTYSSIFIASPIWCNLTNSFKKKAV